MIRLRYGTALLIGVLSWTAGGACKRGRTDAGLNESARGGHVAAGTGAILTTVQGEKLRGNDMTAMDAERQWVTKLFLPGRNGTQDVNDVTDSYPWVVSGRIYRVTDRKEKRTIFVSASGGETAPVSLSDINHPAALSDFVFRQFNGRFPGIDRIGVIATLLKGAAIGPGSSIANANFLRNAKTFGLERWLRGREKDPRVFEGLCTGIHGGVDQNSWWMEFNVFNSRGGVELVKVPGAVAPPSVLSVTVVETKSDGEFFYDLDG